jgi:putative tryptophan/tyrosine transport system substrate-binding protein
MTDRRSFLHCAAALAMSASARAQPAGPTHRVALLVPATTPNEAVFMQALRELGYVEGRNLVIDRRSADGDFARLPSLAVDTVRSRPDVIVAFVTQASIAARQATASIPVVMVAVADPVASGLVTSLARPGGNVTGTSAQAAAIAGKQLDLIRELRPSAARVAVLWNSANAVFQEQSVREARAGAARLGIELRLFDAQSAADLDAAIAAIAAARPDAVLVVGEPLFVANAARLADRLRERRLLAVGGTRAYAPAGMLATYGPDLAESARRAASYVDKILKGTRPGDLPVELATKYELVVNMATARALGIAVPPTLLARADEVIQ